MSAPEGTTFDVSGPLGTGFPVQRAGGRPLIVAVVGSALAVARPILRDRMAQREGPTTHVYIGARSAKDVPLVDELRGWIGAGAHLVLCLSRGSVPGSDLDDSDVLPDVERRDGWVQHVLAKDVHEGRVPQALVFAAGPPAMHEEARALIMLGSIPGGDGAPPLELEVITNV
jgi:NAD(P)H-flavin reductase